LSVFLPVFPAAVLVFPAAVATDLRELICESHRLRADEGSRVRVTTTTIFSVLCSLTLGAFRKRQMKRFACFA